MLYYKKKKKNNTASQGGKSTRKPDLRTKLDREFSRYIRLRDALPDGTFKCISCGQVKPISQADCGHYVNRKHMATRFDEMNCNAQCIACNRFDEGNMSGYRQGLVRKYGERNVLLLEAKKNQTRKYSDFEYHALIKHYKAEAERLSKEKGL